jgi:2-alkyl-3-oxoalkanoate reductase
MKPTIQTKSLVTGGGGFLGKAIARQLLNRGDEVYSFSRGNYPVLSAMGVTQIKGDICDGPAVDNASRGMDTVFHTAAMAGVWGKYEDYYTTNVAGTKNIIAACKAHGVKRLIYTSSASVIYNGKNMTGDNESLPYPHRYMTHYPKTKAMAERLVAGAANGDLSTLILRPHLIWGPEDNHLVPRIIERAHRLAIVGNGKNIADTIYIDNAAEAHLMAADKLIENPGLSGKLYFISQDDRIPVWDMINRILAAAGRPAVTRRIPASMAWVIGGILELIYKTAGLKNEPRMTRFVARELSTSHWYDISAAKRDLGFFPRISTEEGLKRLEEWLRDKP